MIKKALFLRVEENNCDLNRLMDRCRQEQFEIEENVQPADHDALKKLLPSEPAVLFVPAESISISNKLSVVPV